MNVLVKRKYNAIVEDEVLVTNIDNGPAGEQQLKEKLNAGQYECTENYEVLGDESTVEILEINPVDEQYTDLLDSM